MNCQKLSLEASTHAAQNERLPLRVIVQVVFFEQLRLRTAITGWFFVSDNLDNSHNPNSSGLDLAKSTACHQRDTSRVDDMKGRVSELEKECESMKEEFQKLVKTKKSWNIFCRRKSDHCNSKSSKQHCNPKMELPCVSTKEINDKTELQ